MHAHAVKPHALRSWFRRHRQRNTRRNFVTRANSFVTSTRDLRSVPAGKKSRGMISPLVHA